jgi:hypothetical protein
MRCNGGGFSFWAHFCSASLRKNRAFRGSAVAPATPQAWPLRAPTIACAVYSSACAASQSVRPFQRRPAKQLNAVLYFNPLCGIKASFAVKVDADFVLKPEFVIFV